MCVCVCVTASFHACVTEKHALLHDAAETPRCPMVVSFSGSEVVMRNWRAGELASWLKSPPQSSLNLLPHRRSCIRPFCIGRDGPDEAGVEDASMEREILQ